MPTCHSIYIQSDLTPRGWQHFLGHKPQTRPKTMAVYYGRFHRVKHIMDIVRALALFVTGGDPISLPGMTNRSSLYCVKEKQTVTKYISPCPWGKWAIHYGNSAVNASPDIDRDDVCTVRWCSIFWGSVREPDSWVGVHVLPECQTDGGNLVNTTNKSILGAQSMLNRIAMFYPLEDKSMTKGIYIEEIGTWERLVPPTHKISGCPF